MVKLPEYSVVSGGTLEQLVLVVIHASAQAMACAWEAHYLSACALTRLGIFSDSPSICGDSDLRNLYWLCLILS